MGCFHSCSGNEDYSTAQEVFGEANVFERAQDDSHRKSAALPESAPSENRDVDNRADMTFEHNQANKMPCYNVSVVLPGTKQSDTPQKKIPKDDTVEACFVDLIKDYHEYDVVSQWIAIMLLISGKLNQLQAAYNILKDREEPDRDTQLSGFTN